MAKCKNCKHLGYISDGDQVGKRVWCENITDSPDLDIERECDHYAPMTNADKIRNMTENEAIARIIDHFDVHHHDNRPHPLLDKAVEMAINALEEVQQYRQAGTVEECHEAVEKQKETLTVDKAKTIAAKAICIGCGYLVDCKCDYNGGNCMVSKPMLESVLKSFDDWDRRANDGKTD